MTGVKKTKVYIYKKKFTFACVESS